MGFLIGRGLEISAIHGYSFENTRLIFLVVHSEGDWQFLCGGDHEENEIPKVDGIVKKSQQTSHQRRPVSRTY